MEITAYPDAAAFLKENLPLLEREEAANNLLLGIALGMRDVSSVYKEAHFLGIRENGRPVFCALQTPPRNLLIYGRPEAGADCAGLAFSLAVERGIEVPGILGPRALAEPFSKAWSALSGRAWEVKKEMGVFQLEEVIPPVPCRGRLRRVVNEEVELAYQWMCAFNREVLGGPAEQLSRQLVEQHLAQGDLFFWETGMPVGMAAATRPTRNGITINAVYTPPEHRGQGYASNCVARLSSRMLESGYRFCALFTDLANPTSNKIYQAIGYRKIGEFVEIKGG